jgi:methylamine dehydrogenase light chain
MDDLDARVERWIRGLARRTGRRTFLARLGALLVGAATVPLLPVARGASAADSPREPVPDENIPGAEGDPTRCEYWRHCSIDGFACACCGGTASSCPPGTEKSPVAWVGTCRNPSDGKDYIVSYNDCCGKSWCGRCGCNRNEGDRPDYHWVRSNDINWCTSSTTALSYHCSTATVLGRATESQPEK